MKKNWTRLFFLFLAAGMIGVFGACSDDDKKQDGQEQGGGNEGGGDEEEPQNPGVVLPRAAGIYFGDDMEVGAGHYSLILYSEGLDFDSGSWYFDGTGDAVWLEMYAPESPDVRNVVLQSGDYRPVDAEEELAEFTFFTGEDINSFVARCEAGEETDDRIVDGSVRVIWIGESEYAIQLTVRTESGAQKQYGFEGRIDFQVFGLSYGPDPFEGTFQTAWGSYYGDFYGSGAGNIQLMLTDREDEETYPGHQLCLDLNTTLFASQSAIELVPGTYAFDPSQSFSAVSTFNGGFVDEEEYYNGSLWIEYDSEGGETVFLVTGGEATVDRTGEKYTVTATVTLDNGETRTGVYEGGMHVGDESCLTRLDGDVNPVAVKGRAIFNGDVQYIQNNSYNWVIWLAASGVDLDRLDGAGDMMQIEINTPTDSKTEIPTGDYSIIEQIDTHYLLPFTYIPGFIDNLRGLLGTWYTRDLVALAPAVSGTLHIENKGGGNYAIRYDFEDDYYYTRPNRIAGLYEGPLEYVDGTDYAGMHKKAVNGPRRETASQPHRRFRTSERPAVPARLAARR